MSTQTDNARNGTQPSKSSRRWRWLAGTVGGFLAVALVYTAYWAQVLRYHQTTDDAYVGGNVVQITPQIPGTVVGITPYVVAGHRYGSRIDIQPQSAPSLIVSVTQLRSDPSLSVGSNVVSGATRIGVVADLSRVERQALARFTNDSGNHVSVELRPAASLVLN